MMKMASSIHAHVGEELETIRQRPYGRGSNCTYTLTHVCTQDLCFLTYATYAQDLGFLQMTRTLQEASAAQEWKGARVEGGTLL